MYPIVVRAALLNVRARITLSIGDLNEFFSTSLLVFCRLGKQQLLLVRICSCQMYCSYGALGAVLSFASNRQFQMRQIHPFPIPGLLLLASRLDGSSARWIARLTSRPSESLDIHSMWLAWSKHPGVRLLHTLANGVMVRFGNMR